MAMNPLLALFGGQAAAPGMVYNSEGGLEELLLNGNQPAPPADTGPSADEIDKYAGMGLDNSEAIIQRDRAIKSGQDAAEHKGMFGVKGTLRDVLGIVGDGFLVQSGRDPLYMQKREQEKMSDALAGMSVDERAAIERATALNPAMGQKMLDDYLKRNQTDTENLIRAQQATTQQTKADFDILADVRDRAARLLAAAGNDPQARAAAMQQIQSLAAAARQDMGRLGITPNMSDTEANVYARGDMKVSQQEALPRRDRQLDISERNARTAEVRAARPTQPRSVSQQELFEEFRRVPANRRTVEQQNFIDNYTGQNKGKGSLLEQFLEKSPAPTGRRMGPPKR